VYVRWRLRYQVRRLEGRPCGWYLEPRVVVCERQGGKPRQRTLALLDRITGADARRPAARKAFLADALAALRGLGATPAERERAGASLRAGLAEAARRARRPVVCWQTPSGVEMRPARVQ
jgi:hypothetical protein